MKKIYSYLFFSMVLLSVNSVFTQLFSSKLTSFDFERYVISPIENETVSSYYVTIREDYTDKNFNKVSYEYTPSKIRNSKFLATQADGYFNALRKKITDMEPILGVDQSELSTIETPYIHFQIEAGDVKFIDKRNKFVKSVSGDNRIEVSYSVDVVAKITYVNGNEIIDVGELVLDDKKKHYKSFPKQFSINRTPTKDSLEIVWEQYKHSALDKWREETIKDFCEKVASLYYVNSKSGNQTFKLKVYSDANKKGNFDQVVEAADELTNILNGINATSTDRENHYLWNQETQEKLKANSEKWYQYLSENKKNRSGRELYTNNFLVSTILSGDFKRAKNILDGDFEGVFYLSKTDFDNFSVSELKNLIESLENEYNKFGEKYGWYKIN